MILTSQKLSIIQAPAQKQGLNSRVLMWLFLLLLCR